MTKTKLPKITRRDFARSTLGLAAASTQASSWGNSKTRQPNILFIMADDLGYGDLSCFGRPDYRTPVIDKLAKQGIKLTHTYANSPVCSPTRTALLTGLYQYRLRAGLEEPIAAINYGVPSEQATLANTFSQAGYQTALVGKWHLGAAPDYGPIKNGYQHFFGFYPGGVDYFAHKIHHGKIKFSPKAPRSDGLWRDDRTPVKAEGYLTDVLSDEAIHYIESFNKNSQPFLLSLHYSAPHWPWVGPNDVRRARDLTTVLDSDGGNAKVYAEMVKSLDTNVGRVLAALEATGQSDNTIVVFTSDNGGERFSYNWPFLGKKGELLEGGIRVPGIVRWPAAIKSEQVSEQVLSSMDWMPTLLAAAGIPIKPEWQLDGENLLAEITDAKQQRQRTLYWRFKSSSQAAVREGEWKYLKLNQEEHLFNLQQDEREQADLKRVQPKIFARLKQQYAKWNASMLPYPEDSYSHGNKSLYTDRY